MQLETYISDLLYRYECVTIPDFGAFLTQKTSATINETSNIFYAPKKMLSFNEQIQKNDGLLANYIADLEKIPFETANKKIAKRVKLLKSYLTQGETINFKNIGEIVFNEEGKILFEPCYHLNYLTDSFGLTQFVSPCVNREVYKQTVKTIEKVTPITITPESRKARPYLKYAAVALVALTLGGLVSSNFYVKKIEEYNQLAQEEATKQLDNKIQQATFNLNPLPAITLNIDKESGNYHIVAGAFRVKENSDKKVEELTTLGYKAKNIGLNKFGLYEVVYGSYETGKEALTAVHDIRKTHNRDAWIKVDSESNKEVSTPKKVFTKTEITSQKTYTANSESDVTNQVSKVQKEVQNFDNPNIIQIIRELDNTENGYYLILGSFTDALKKDAFLKTLKSTGLNNANFFFHKKSSNYLVYQEKFNDLGDAQKALKTSINLASQRKIKIVKVEN